MCRCGSITNQGMALLEVSSWWMVCNCGLADQPVQVLIGIVLIFLDKGECKFPLLSCLW